MSRMLSIQMRPSSMTASQLGSHEWLMKRASLPFTAASITTSSSIANRNVWCRSPSTSG
jgi:hypothetical protein